MCGGKIVIVSEHQTVAGVWLSADSALPFTPENIALLGGGLLDALSRSQSGVTHPKDWKAIFVSVLRASGAKSFKAFMQAAKHVGVEAADETLVLRPSRNLGVKDGLEPKSEVAIESNAEAHAAGAALLAALTDAE